METTGWAFGRSRRFGAVQEVRGAVRASVLVMVLIAASLFWVGRADAATLAVCPSGCAYSTITSAVAAAAANDTINVGAGTYVEDNILIDKPLKIVGAGVGAVTVTGNNRDVGSADLYQVFDIRPPASGPAGNIELSGMTVTDPPFRSSGVSGFNTSSLGIRMRALTPTTPVAQIVFTDMFITGRNVVGTGLRSDALYGHVGGPINGVDPVPPALVVDNTRFGYRSHNGLLLEDWNAPVTVTNSYFERDIHPTSSYSDILIQTTKNETKPNTFPQVIQNNEIHGSGVWFSFCAGGSNLTRYTWDDIQVLDNVFTEIAQRDVAINIGGDSCAPGQATSAGNNVTTATMGDVVITGNVIAADGTQADVNGVRVIGPTRSVLIEDNSITGFPAAVLLRQDAVLGAPAGVVVHRNRLIANVLGVSNTATSDVSALENWWGCQKGPDSGSTYCSEIGNTGGGSVDASTWLITTPRLTLLPDLTGDGDATLSLTNEGVSVPLADDMVTVFDGLSAAWANTPGSVDPLADVLDFGSYGLDYGTASDTAVTVTPASSCGVYVTTLDAVPLAEGQFVSELGDTVTGEPVPIYWCVMPTGASFTQSIVSPDVVASFAIVDGVLPAGLALDPASGVITGIPTEDGSFPFTVEVTYADGTTDLVLFTYLVVDPPVITSDPPADGTVGTAYSHTVEASGAPTITYSIVGGSLPPGLTLDPATGVISGTPTADGVYTFSVQAENDYGTDVAEYTITIGDPPVITSDDPADGQVGESYSHTVTADGAGPITFAIVSGSLPPGLTLDPATGVISGTPTTDGAYTFTVEATNEYGTDSAEYMIVIGDLPIITSDDPADGSVGGAYSHLVTAGGAGPITFSVVDGSLPPGLVLDPTTGLISGTPTAPGTYTFTIRAENEYGYDEATYTVVIDDAATTTTTTAAGGSTTSTSVSNGTGSTATPATPSGGSGAARPGYRAPDAVVNAASNGVIVSAGPPPPASTQRSTDSSSAVVRGASSNRSVAFTGSGSARLVLASGLMLLVGAFSVAAASRRRRQH